MRTDGIPDPDPVTYQEYPEHRSAEQLKIDGISAQRQLEAMASRESADRNDKVVSQIQARQDRAPKPYALPFDRFPVVDSSGQETYVLVARGQLVVRVDRRDDRRPGDTFARPVPPDVLEILRRLHYRPVSDTGQRTVVFERMGDQRPGQLAKDIQTLRRQRIVASAHQVVPLGYIIKGDAYPTVTTGLGTFAPSPGTPNGVRVAVIDTGITPEDRKDDWLDGVVRQPANTELLDVLPVTGPVPGDGRLDWSSGHGTFVAGVVHRVAPTVEVVAYRFTRSDGLGTEDEVAAAMIQAATDGANLRLIINLSLGTAGINGAPPIRLADAVQQVKQINPNALLVASAGNLGNTEKMYPAALDGVVAVGALKDDMTPAPFSNYGEDWVTCSTVGVGIVSTFVPGVEPPEADPTTPDYAFPADSWAVWNGTSFAAPQISARVAMLCQADSKLLPREALDALLAGKPTQPGYGAIVRLLPGTPLP